MPGLESELDIVDANGGNDINGMSVEDAVGLVVVVEEEGKHALDVVVVVALSP